MPAVKTQTTTQTTARVRQLSWPSPGSLASAADRAGMGRTARSVVPRQEHATLDLPSDRPDPVDLLQRQAANRLPDLVPVRYGRMLASPFAYFRGAALPMASDLASTPVTGLAVQACGDAHMSNFGVFGSPERRLVFDINDFDETLPGPWEWDVKRLAASLEIAGRDNGFTPKQRRKTVLGSISRYREQMRAFAGMNDIDVWYSRVDIEQVRTDIAESLSSRMRKRVDRGMAKARSNDSMRALDKLTMVEDGQRRIIADPPLIVPVSALLPGAEEYGILQSLLPGLIVSYRKTLRPDYSALLGRYEFVDMARKVVGVGSVGTRCWIVLMLGSGATDPLFLQIKEAEQSVLSEFAGPSKYANQGERVVTGQRFTQASSDIFLGWLRVAEGVDGRQHDYYVRQLRDWKLSLDIDGMSPASMQKYGELCGWTLARAHARTGDRIAISAYLGASTVFENAIADFAASYAELNERDYQHLKRAAASGRVLADTHI
jgi:uncharacterized protein (DUF2252 family)